MKTNWLEIIAAQMHRLWMDFRVQQMGQEKAQQHKHFKLWDDLQSVQGGLEAMNQDRFVASLILLAFAQGKIPNSAALAPLIHNSVQLWIRLTGEELKNYHVPYETSDDPAINEWMKKERTMQAEPVWSMLQSMENMENIRKFDWVHDL